MRAQRLSILAAAVLVVGALGPVAQAGPITFGPNSAGGINAYMLVDPGADFPTAVTAAQITFPGWGSLAPSGDVGHLVDYASDSELGTIRGLRNMTGDNVYVGLTDNPAYASDAFEDGDNSGGVIPANGTVAAPGERGAGWAWVPTNSLNTFHVPGFGASIWGGGEPNNWAGNEHAAELRSDGYLNDMIETTVRAYIVEWDLNLAYAPTLGIGPSGGMGTWGIREVSQNGTIASAVAAINSLMVNEANPGSGLRYEATNRIEINFHDPDATGGSGDHGGDLPYLVDVPGVDDEDFALLANGTIRIAAGQGGLYTFYARGDDGFRLKIVGQNWTKVNGSDAGLAYISGDELWFNDPTGNSNTYGVIDLAPGDYQVEYVWFERGGGANNELSALKGDHSTGANLFPLVGHKSLGTVGTPGFSGQVMMTASAPGRWSGVTVDSLQDALDAIAEGQAAGTNSTGFYTVVNHSDPDDGGGLNRGSFGGDLAYPNDAAGVDDEDFGVLVQGVLEIPITGTYQFGYNSDDGAAMQIFGQMWKSIVPGSHDSAMIVGDQLITDALTGWSWTAGEIDLLAGTYDFGALMFERGGGAFFELFGRGVYPGGQTGAWQLLVTGGAGLYTDPDGLELVPEPATLALLGVGGVLMLLRRKR